jgi:hypothetical protein
MAALTFITDETHNRRYVQIDLAEVAEINDDQLEEMMDIIIAEARKEDEKIKIEDLENQLKNEGYL